jgi:hypothetical protein
VGGVCAGAAGGGGLCVWVGVGRWTK